MSNDNPIPIDDLFLIWSELRVIAKSVADLLGTDKVTPHTEKLLHFQNKVIEWSRQCADVQKKRAGWAKKRLKHEQRIYKEPHLQNKKDRPGEDWSFVPCSVRDDNELFVRFMKGWVPAELDYENAPPEPCLPLPIPKEPPTLAERFAALAAIHDCFEDARHKIDPWAWAGDDDSISVKDYAAQIAPHASRYDALKDVVKQCQESEFCPWLKDYELSPDQKHSKDTLLAWLDDVSDDLQASKGSAGPEAGGKPTEHETPAKKAELGAVDRKKMQVYTSSGWVDVSRPKLLDAIEALTREKGVWLPNWNCFGTDSQTSTKMHKELAEVSPAISLHIESGPSGYRWVDSPAASKKLRKPKRAS